LKYWAVSTPISLLIDFRFDARPSDSWDLSFRPIDVWGASDISSTFEGADFGLVSLDYFSE